MPRLDGFGLCEAIRASPKLRSTPVILLTARETPEDRARGMEAGADAYLLKSSFDQQSLLSTIEQLLG
jgi:two-component system chemotaxis sensor kinase CheA